MSISDEDAAAQAISCLVDLSKQQIEAQKEIDVILKSGDDDSFVDVNELFKLYNVLYFRGILLPRVEVSWSERLTLCAGICELIKDYQGKYRRIRLKLSSALLKFRPRSDLLNTLLHESIHAYFFITSAYHHIRDPTGGHGSGFQLLASAINDHGGYDITQFHEFHDEVDSFRTHIWLCDGPCKTKPPFFGLVKRSMNRSPGKSDTWWTKHEQECGGTYTKISEPEKTKKQIESMTGLERAGLQKNKIDSWFRNPSKKRSVDDNDAETPPPKLVSCPICSKKMPPSDINHHLDSAHLN